MALCCCSTFLGIFLIVVAAFVWLIRRRYAYWSSRGVTQLEPTFLIGNLNFKESMDLTFLEHYKKFKTKGLKFGGVYMFWKPSLIVLDPDLLKNIMIKDFDYFMNRGLGRLNDKDPLAGMLPFLEDEEWKSMRSKLTPTFTSGKLKMMFETFVGCSRVFKEVLNTYADANDAVDVKEILSNFTLEIISSCAFGLESNTMKNPESELKKIVDIVFKPSAKTKFLSVLFPILPISFLRMLNIHMLPKTVESFFVNLVKDLVEYRETNDVYRKDFMHLMIQLKNRGKVTDDEIIKDEKGSTQSFLKMEDIYAQCFVFLTAGFETSATTMTFALYELSRNEDIQEKLRQEIDEVLRKHENKLTYDAISEMTYLDHVLKETLRMHPPLGIITRECVKDYKIPNTNVVIEKGTIVNIPVLGIHMDETYYPNPEKFDPDRFTEANTAKRPGCTWLPFGEGPRLCIGLRFGLLQSKVGLVTLLKDFKITLNNRTKIPLVLDNGASVRSVLGGMWLNINRLR